MARDYDIVLFGASGFTGELTARYLAAHVPEGASWALAGRDRSRLAEVRSGLAAVNPAAAALPILVADSHDETALATLAGSTRVVISTVGPYLLHGEPLIAACVHAGTDYVDLCAESEFVDRVYLHYHEAARQSGARIVHSCGFDSLVTDLGVLYTIGTIADAERQPIAVEGFVAVTGAISGGTFSTLLNAIGRLKESGRASRQRRSVERHADDGRLAEGRAVHAVARRPHRAPEAGGWVVPAPIIDRQHVLRSARLNEAYGPDFSYAHYLVTRTFLRTVRLLFVVGLIATLAQLRTMRRLLVLIRRPGRGPSESKRAKASFRVRFLAHVGGNSACDVVTEIGGGDPGYGETSKMLAESALCLAFDEVPAPGGGQWTSAVALGRPLIDRLINAGISFRVIKP